jgi:hypothetical protein
MLLGLRLHVKPAGKTVLLRATVPVSPFIEATVIVEVPTTPAGIVTDVGLAVMLRQSQIALVIVTEWDSMPLVAVTAMVKVPAVVLTHDNVEVCDAPRTILFGERLQVRPAGETADVNATVPVNPFTGMTVIVDVAATPGMILMDVGFAVTAKSVIAKDTVVV